MPRPLTALLALPIVLACAPTFAAPDLVIVVRHAEKAVAPADDPALSPPGEARAQALAQALAGAGVGTIITTQYRRTVETSAPTAKLAGVVPLVIEARRGDGPAHVQAVLAAVRAATGTVLVVGHSNTVGSIVGGLSKTEVVPLCETSFSHLFVVQPREAESAVLHARYGAPDVPAASGCQ